MTITPTQLRSRRFPTKLLRVPEIWIALPASHYEQMKRHLPDLLESDPGGVDRYLRAYWEVGEQALSGWSLTEPRRSGPRMARDVEEWPFEVPSINIEEWRELEGEGHWSEVYSTEAEALQAALDSGAEGAVYVVEDDGDYYLYFLDDTE